MAEFKQRHDIHWPRRLWHFVGVMAMVVLYQRLTRDEAVRLAILFTTIWVGLDVLRLFFSPLNRILTKIFGPFMRESERNRLAGSTTMLLGVTLIVFLYPKVVVLLTLLFFAIADPLASLVGIRYGKDKLIGNKSFQGSLAAFAVCAILALVYCWLLGLMTERLVIVAVLSGLIGAISELIPVGKLDDNFIFPVMSASLLTLMFELFGGLNP